jgi:hypothetical protein
MTARIIDCIVVSVDIENRNEFPVDLNAFAATRFNFTGFTDLDEIAHAWRFLSRS